MAAANRISPQPFGGIERVLRVLVWLYVPISLALVMASAIDDSELLRENVWMKPLKFSISIGLNGAAFLWLLRRVPSTKIMRIAAFASAAALVMEQVLISVQAARGVRSHFNMTSGIDSTIYGAMGNFVGIVWIATLAMAIGLMRRKISDPTVKRVSIAGTWLVLLGASVGFVMVAVGRHTIGAQDGGPILPFVGWNQNAGDLRPAHFVALHGLQVLIAIVWFAHRKSWSNSVTVRVLTVASFSIAATCLSLLGQALTVRPVTSLSTLLVAGLAAFTGSVAWAANASPRNENS
jgi:hypothetical protein